MRIALNMKDIAIIDALPQYSSSAIQFGNDIWTVLNIGCGDGRIDFHLANIMECRAYAVDTKPFDSWRSSVNLSFHIADIFKLSSMPVKIADIVICSQVLEHLGDYKKAVANLMALGEIRIIITVPVRDSFSHPGHKNFWDDSGSKIFKDINEFRHMCRPFSVSISKIKTKPDDTSQRDYLIIIDKRQKTE